MGNLQKIGHICFHIVGVSAGYVRYVIKYVIKCLCQMYFRYGVNRFEWVLKVWTQRVLLTYSWYCLNVCICFVGYFGGILEKIGYAWKNQTHAPYFKIYPVPLEIIWACIIMPKPVGEATLMKNNKMLTM